MVTECADTAPCITKQLCEQSGQDLGQAGNLIVGNAEVSVFGMDLSQKSDGIMFNKELASCINGIKHAGHGNHVIIKTNSTENANDSIQGTGRETGGGKGYIGKEELAFTLSTHQDQSIMQETENKYIIYRCKIEGTCKGERFLYQDQGLDKSGIYFPNDKGREYFYWQQGNMSCDCNRIRFISGGVIVGWDADGFPCGETIRIDKISPIDDDTIPIIELNESNSPVKPIIYDTTQVTSVANGSNPKPGDPCHPLVKNGHVLLLIEQTFSDNSNRGFRVHNAVAPPLLRNMGTGGGNVPFVQQPIVLDDQGGSIMNVSQNGQVGTLRAQTHAHAHAPILLQPSMLIVRRLTPKECGRLQGFPDEYLEKVPGYSDNKAYAAFGNSMTTNVMQWIGQRIELVDAQIKKLNASKTT